MKKNHKILKKIGLLTVFTTSVCINANAQFKTEETPMMKGVTKNIKNGWKTEALITVGETNVNDEDVNKKTFSYKFPGILDGIAAWKKGVEVKILVNHEVGDDIAYPYQLANGTTLIGSRISYLTMSRLTRNVNSMGLAYNKVYDRAGKIVTNASQINEGAISASNKGFNRFCSSYGVEAYRDGFVNDIYFTGEETGGGQFCALDVNSQTLHVVPMLGRAAFENAGSIENFSSNKVAILIGDDRGGAPLYLYVGQKGSNATGYNPSLSFLKNNGLSNGRLYVWVSDSIGERDVTSFKGTGSIRSGKFVGIEHYDPTKAGQLGYDVLGFVTQEVQDARAEAVKNFKFSRPEDLATNPYDKTQVVMASTGLSSFAGGADSWGDVYVIDFDDVDLKEKLRMPLSSINNIKATIKIVYDGDDAGNGQVAGPDFGIRSPDNVEWAKNGMVYINEDKSFSGFGQTSKIEASMWQLDPVSGAIERCLEMDRNAVPYKQTDAAPTDIGNWESSGVLDVTDLFFTLPGETLLITDVQAHSVNSTIIGGNAELSQGGQLLLASKKMNKKYNSSLSRTTQKEDTTISKNNDSFEAYPNPASETLTFNKNTSIFLYDAAGTLVVKKENINQLDVSNIKAGVYLLKTDKGETQEVIIQH